jgi:hypothetical protein
MELRYKWLLMGTSVNRIIVFREDLGELTIDEALKAAVSVVREQSQKPALFQVWIYRDIDETWGDGTLVWTRPPIAHSKG